MMRPYIVVIFVILAALSGIFFREANAARFPVGEGSGVETLEWVAENIGNVMSAGVSMKRKYLAADIGTTAGSENGYTRQILIRASVGLHSFVDIVRLGLGAIAARLEQMTIAFVHNFQSKFKGGETAVEVRNGVVVFPSSGNAALDSETIAKLAGTFSDEIIVIPGSNESPGIIKPVFRDSVGEDYLYLVVPLQK